MTTFFHFFSATLYFHKVSKSGFLNQSVPLSQPKTLKYLFLYYLQMSIKQSFLFSPNLGMMDNFVGGGITEGLGVKETAVKEAAEEAGIDSEFASKMVPAGSVSFLHRTERGIHPNTEFVFDLELPDHFVPRNTDGEVRS